MIADQAGRPWPFSEGLSDKITQGYFPEYLKIAADLGPSARVCELGVYGGDSLRIWQALFPRGTVAGVDCDPGCTWPEGTIRVIAAQEDPGLPGMLAACAPFGLVADDASHAGDLTARAFAHLWPLVAPGGYYVIEDWWVSLRPNPQFGGGTDGGAMLAAVTAMLAFLDAPDAECEQVTCRYGLAIARKRGRYEP